MRTKSRGSKPRPMISFSSAAAIFALATSTMPSAASVTERPSGSAIFSLIAFSARSRRGLKPPRSPFEPKVASWAGERGGALRADPEPTAELVDPGDRAAAGADRDHLDRGHPVAPLAEQGVVGGERLAGPDGSGVERGAAHVGGGDVMAAEVVGDAGAADQAADRPGADREDRPVGAEPERDHAAVALHDVELTGEADVGEAILDSVQVGAGDRADVGVDQGGDEALVLADRLGDLAGDRHEDARGALGDDLAGEALVGVVADRPEEGDRDRLDPGGEQRVGGLGDRGLIEGD